MADLNQLVLAANVNWHKFYEPGSKQWTSLSVRMDIGSGLFVDISISGDKNLKSKKLAAMLRRLKDNKQLPFLVTASFIQKKKKDGSIQDTVRCSIGNADVQHGQLIPINLCLIRGRVKEQSDSVILVETSFFNPKKDQEGGDGWDRRLVPIVHNSSVISDLVGQKVFIKGRLETKTPSGKEKLFVRSEVIIPG